MSIAREGGRSIRKSEEQLTEFLRYAVVGGAAFAIDFAGLVLGRELLFKGFEPSIELSLSTALGFITGLLANYVLSNHWVFRKTEQQRRGRSVRGFIVFTVIGIIGLGLTELGMHLGVRLVGDESFAYMGVKVFVAALVLLWNYGARKRLIYGD